MRRCSCGRLYAGACTDPAADAAQEGVTLSQTACGPSMAQAWARAQPHRVTGVHVGTLRKEELDALFEPIRSGAQ